MLKTLFTIAGVQIAWWASALGAAHGMWWPGTLAGIAVTALAFAVLEHPRALALAIAAALVAGIAVESTLAAAGLVTYGAPVPAIGLAPIWLVALWMAFATSTGMISGLVGDHRPYLWSALLGAVTAPPTYFVGERFGALAIAGPMAPTLVAIAVLWGIALPLLVWIWRRSLGAATTAQTGSPPA